MWKMKRFDHIIWMILLIGIHCVNKSFAETKYAFNPDDTKGIKLEVTDTDGHVLVKEVNGEEMACVMKCFPVKAKKCKTKSPPDVDAIVNTTPIPIESDETTDAEMTTGPKMSTMSFRSATNFTKKEQAVSAEATTEMSHSKKKETEKIKTNEENSGTTLVPTKRTPTTKSIVTTKRLKSTKLKTTPDISTTTTSQLDIYSDYNSVPLLSDPDTLDLVTDLEINNRPSYRMLSPKTKLTTKQPITRKKHSKSKGGCDNDQLCDTKLPYNDPVSERRYKKKLSQSLHSTISTPIQTKEHKSSTYLIESTTAIEDSSKIQIETTTKHKGHNSRRHSHEDYDIECDSTEHSDEIFVTTKPLTPASKIPVETYIIYSQTKLSTKNNLETSTSISPTPSTNPTSSTNLSTSTTLKAITADETSSIGESLRRMSESEEMFTECDSSEENLNQFGISTPTNSRIEFRSFLNFHSADKSLSPATLIDTTTDTILSTTHNEIDATTVPNLESIRPNYLTAITDSTPDETILTTTNKDVTDITNYESIEYNPFTTTTVSFQEEIPSTTNGNSNIVTTEDIRPTDLTTIPSSPVEMIENNKTVVTTIPNIESMRRMSESDEEITDCESDEVNMLTTISHNTTTKILSTTPKPIASTNTDLITLTPTTTKPLTTSNLKISTINETLRRMSESDEDCESAENLSSSRQVDSETQNSQIASTTLEDHQTSIDILLTTEVTPSSQSSRSLTVTMLPITDSMRRMSESEENVSDCESHEDNVIFTTMGPNISDSMRRMSLIDILTTELNSDDQSSPPAPTTADEEPIEFVTECDTEGSVIAEGFPTTQGPLMTEATTTTNGLPAMKFNLATKLSVITDVPEKPPSTETPLLTQVLNSRESETVVQYVKETKNGKTNALSCCPDAVCSLMYPNLPTCDAKGTKAPVDYISNFTDNVNELRDMFYLYKTQVLISKMLDDSDYIKKRLAYEHHLISLWNEKFSRYLLNNTENCTYSSSNQNSKEIIASIHCFLNHTSNLLNDDFLKMILQVVSRIETKYPNKKVVRYPKLRSIISEAIPKVSKKSDVIQSLVEYMQRNRKYEKERLFVLQLLLDYQERFEDTFFGIDESSENHTHAETTNSPESLQENGLGIKMHRTPK